MAASQPLAGRLSTGFGARSRIVIVVLALVATACSGGNSTTSAGDDQPDVTSRELRVPGTEVVPEEEPTNAIIEGQDDDSADAESSDPEDGASTSIDPAAVPDGVELVADVSYNDDNGLDIYKPTQDGRWPVVVFFPGRGSDKSVYVRLAGEVAEAGAVVFVANWRGQAQPPAPIADSRCAIDTAMALAEDHDGDRSSLTVVGASFGAVAAAGIALDGPWVDVELDRDCPVPESSASASALVGLVGDFDSFDGLEPDDDAYLSYSPFSQLSDGSGPRIRVVHGEPDRLGEEQLTSERFHEAAEDAGYDSELVLLDHPNLELFGVRFDEESRSVEVLPGDADLSGVRAAAQQIVAAFQAGPST